MRYYVTLNIKVNNLILSNYTTVSLLPLMEYPQGEYALLDTTLYYVLKKCLRISERQGSEGSF